MRDEEVLFSLADVVRVLAAENGRYSGDDAGKGFKGLFAAQIEALESDEYEVVREPQTRGYDLPHQTYVTQPGLFRVVMRDTSPAAKQFQRWVLHEVLPSIQRHGTYPPPTKNETSSEIRRATEILLQEIKAREALEQKTKELERETKAKFIEHENRIDELADKMLVQIGSDRLAGCISVQAHCAGRAYDSTKLQFVFAMSQKLSLEQNVPHGRRESTGNSLADVVFHPTIIEEAIKHHDG